MKSKLFIFSFCIFVRSYVSTYIYQIILLCIRNYKKKTFIIIIRLIFSKSSLSLGTNDSSLILEKFSDNYLKNIEFSYSNYKLDLQELYFIAKSEILVTQEEKKIQVNLYIKKKSILNFNFINLFIQKEFEEESKLYHSLQIPQSNCLISLQEKNHKLTRNFVNYVLKISKYDEYYDDTINKKFCGVFLVKNFNFFL